LRRTILDGYDALMRIDCHVHVCADTPDHGRVSPRLRRSINFLFMRWHLSLPWDNGEVIERAVEAKLVETLRQTEGLDAVVALAFDAVHDADGVLDEARTHLHVTNDYVAELAKRYAGVLFGASVHPYRKDALAELERCVARGAVLLKWLPITQAMNPADERCLPFYDALAHHKLPLLCHTGGENALPNLDKSTADPMLLVPALKRGVTVIAAHCGTRAAPWETDYLPAFLRLAREYEHFYGDTSALNLPTRSYAFEPILNDPVVRSKLIHGSDWPILAIPPRRLGRAGRREMWAEKNWMRRDVLIKQRLGFDEEYWQRAARVLRQGSA
jgi:predicted TIM-barrel fold metal-dependent hydrolase